MRLAAIPRTQTAFRLENRLLERLKLNARKSKESLNQYVERILVKEVGLAPEFPRVPKGFFDDLSEMDNYTLGRMPSGHLAGDPARQVEKDDDLLGLLLSEKYDEGKH